MQNLVASIVKITKFLFCNYVIIANMVLTLTILILSLKKPIPMIVIVFLKEVNLNEENRVIEQNAFPVTFDEIIIYNDLCI